MPFHVNNITPSDAHPPNIWAGWLYLYSACNVQILFGWAIVVDVTSVGIDLRPVVIP